MGYFRMLVDYESGSPQTLPYKPQEPQGTQPRTPTICPPFAPCFQMFLYFCRFRYPKIPRKHQSPSKNSLFLPLFSLFQPLFALIWGYRGAPIVQRGKERKKGTEQRKEKRKGKGAASPQAHKPTKKGYPPLLQGTGSRSPHHKFAPKNREKVAWDVLKKFSEKFFVGMFRGKEKPLALSQRKGVLKMKIVK